MNTDKEQKPYLSWFPSDIESEDVEFEWECFLDELDELVKQVNPDGYWYCTVKNFGWQSQSGHAFLEFSAGRDMIDKVLPRTECSFHIFREENNLKIQNYHHDSPMGNEWYELTPISYEQYENQSM